MYAPLPQMVKKTKIIATMGPASSDPKVILNSEKVVFPGVGAFPDGMKALKKLDLISVIQDYVLSQKPLLAICLGMELLFDES